MSFNLFRNFKEKQFWKWFSKNSNLYLNFENNQDELFDILSSKLYSIDKNLTFEFSPLLKNNKREFIISADGVKSSFSSVEKLVKNAPELSNWIIISFRQAKKDYSGINIENTKFKNEDVFFKYSKKDNKLGLELNIRNYNNNDNWDIATYLLLDNLIGEYDTEIFIDWIERKQLIESEIQNLYNLNELPELIKKLKQEIFGK